MPYHHTLQCLAALYYDKKEPVTAKHWPWTAELSQLSTRFQTCL